MFGSTSRIALEPALNKSYLPFPDSPHIPLPVVSLPTWTIPTSTPAAMIFSKLFLVNAYNASAFSVTEYPFQAFGTNRSEEHTSELQSRFDIVCRLLLEKKN